MFGLRRENLEDNGTNKRNPILTLELTVERAVVDYRKFMKKVIEQGNIRFQEVLNNGGTERQAGMEYIRNIRMEEREAEKMAGKEIMKQSKKRYQHAMNKIGTGSDEERRQSRITIMRQYQKAWQIVISGEVSAQYKIIKQAEERCTKMGYTEEKAKKYMEHIRKGLRNNIRVYDVPVSVR